MSEILNFLNKSHNNGLDLGLPAQDPALSLIERKSGKENMYLKIREFDVCFDFFDIIVIAKWLYGSNP